MLTRIWALVESAECIAWRARARVWILTAFPSWSPRENCRPHVRASYTLSFSLSHLCLLLLLYFFFRMCCSSFTYADDEAFIPWNEPQKKKMRRDLIARKIARFDGSLFWRVYCVIYMYRNSGCWRLSESHGRIFNCFYDLSIKWNFAWVFMSQKFNEWKILLKIYISMRKVISTISHSFLWKCSLVGIYLWNEKNIYPCLSFLTLFIYCKKKL